MYSRLNFYSVRTSKYFYGSSLAILICTRLPSHSNFIKNISVYQSTVYYFIFQVRIGELRL